MTSKDSGHISFGTISIDSQHRFKEIEGGVEATDLVHYALALDPLGRIVNSLIVTKQLNEIFDFRSDYLENRFGIIE